MLAFYSDDNIFPLIVHRVGPIQTMLCMSQALHWDGYRAFRPLQKCEGKVFQMGFEAHSCDDERSKIKRSCAKSAFNMVLPLKAGNSHHFYKNPINVACQCRTLASATSELWKLLRQIDFI